MKDTMTNAWFHQLKAANRLLIKKNGGIEASADITSMSKSQIGRCHSDGDTELLPLPAQLRLEAECGDPVVTRVMAGLHGCKLTDPDSLKSDSACIMTETLELGARTTNYQRNAMLAASDMKISPVEARAGLRDLQPIREKVAELERMYGGILAQGGADVAALKIVGGD